jgi:hypothetical protein
MRSRIWLWLVTLSCSAVLCISSVPAATEPFMVYDPTLSQDALPPWLAYLGARSAFRKEHHLKAPAKGEIVPTFDEEIEARKMACGFYVVLKASNPDPYWETMTKVVGAGFMPEYVWTYLHRNDWPSSQKPKKLAAFENWSRANLKNHKAQTRGLLQAGPK